ncbi:MAG: hypothetical protein HYS26_04830 [Candidatus Kaiserbacteria bacterium]|nr:MAG: hypothetical protein HYS26_04830 [Candidatus Kaiserbacteria bacterium]
MDITKHTQPSALEKYAFLWSEVRLVIAAVALLIGGFPPILLLLPTPATWLLLRLAWIISGLAAGYLLYRWYTGGQKVFGGKDSKDLGAFFVSVVSGLNLGILGLLGTNIGMSIASGRVVFAAVAVLYLLAAWHLHKRWRASGEKLFV